jgi:hypothetical protein
MINFYHEGGVLKTYGVHPCYPRHPWLVFLVPAPAGLGPFVPFRGQPLAFPAKSVSIREGMSFVNGAPWNTQDAVAERTEAVSP